MAAESQSEYCSVQYWLELNVLLAGGHTVKPYTSVSSGGTSARWTPLSAGGAPHLPECL